ncbi:DNA mismatch repair protein [Metarhizium acridum]|nr:DNA mismatch repair protein [Metarhizium acridum]
MEEMDLDAPAGTKRKADDIPDDPRPARRIKALDPDVVNKIAAGEIIVAPVHALKELIENAVDAGSTALEILVKDGGLKLLQITDNGCGIEKEDLAILCERHTTSKITAFEDLSSIATYGFRGEALASISHIAHLSVSTKTKDSPLAWRAHYLDGKMVAPKPGQPAEPKGVAGRPGTQITVEDLFFSIPTRRRAFRSYSDEFIKSSTWLAAIPSTVKAFFSVRCTLGLQSSRPGDQRKLSYQKDDFPLLFINNRSVESANVKKAIEQTYLNFLPKGGHPFIYLSLEIDPARVDVNVPPNKREVHFLNEDEILHAVCTELESRLANVDTSRTFKTQTLLPGAKHVAESIDENQPSPRIMVTGKRRRNSNDLVRTDTYARKITTMFSHADSGEASKEKSTEEEPLAVPENIEYETNDREMTICRLKSIKELRSEVRDNIHHDLTEIFASHTFVGIVDDSRRLAAIQSGVRLYLVDYGHTCFEYFYQVGLTDFGNFGVIRFSPALKLRDLLQMAAETEKKVLGAADHDFPVEKIVDKVANQLIERREMLHEYFSLEVSPTGELVSIPLMVKGYTPPLSKLPRFLLRLGPNVNWNDEKECFDSFTRELATFYVPEQLPTPPAPGEGEDEEEIPEEMKTRRQHVRWAVEHIFFPAFKTKLVATKALMDGGILEVASLKGLYKVFERC